MMNKWLHKSQSFATGGTRCLQHNPWQNHFVHQIPTWNTALFLGKILREHPRLTLDVMAAEGERDEWKLGSGNKAEAAAAARAIKRAEKESALWAENERGRSTHNSWKQHGKSTRYCHHFWHYEHLILNLNEKKENFSRICTCCLFNNITGF